MLKIKEVSFFITFVINIFTTIFTFVIQTTIIFAIVIIITYSITNGIPFLSTYTIAITRIILTMFNVQFYLYSNNLMLIFLIYSLHSQSLLLRSQFFCRLIKVKHKLRRTPKIPGTVTATTVTPMLLLQSR